MTLGEYLKEKAYIQAEKEEMERKEWEEWQEYLNRKPAKVIIIKESNKIKEYEPENSKRD